MSEFICLVVGLAVGGLGGVTMMCLLQINRINDRKSNGKMEVSDDEKNN